MANTSYKIVSGVRKRTTRQSRLLSTSASRPARFVAGGELVVRRGKPTIVTEAVLLKHLEELKRGVAEGRYLVLTVDGRAVDLDSLKAAPAPAVAPKPNPPLDSAANDKTFKHGVGMAMPQYVDGIALTEKAESPGVSADLAAMSDEQPVEDSSDPVGERRRRRQKKSE